MRAGYRQTSPGGLAGHSAALIGLRGGTRGVPRRRLRLVPGTCGDRGFGALPGHCHFTRGASTASDESEMAVPTVRRTRRVCASEASAEQERAPLSPWFGALPGHVLTRPRAPASGMCENCASGLRSRRVARSERSERARLGMVRSPPRALPFHTRSEHRERRVRNGSAHCATNP